MADAGVGRVGHSHAARDESVASRLSATFGAALKLVVPVALLLVTATAAFVYSNIAVTWITGPNDTWLTMGQLLLPLTFLAIHLTNRRYGAGFALAQVIGAWIVGLLAFQAVHVQLASLAQVALPGTRETAGFAIGLVAAQLAAVFVFDRTRGPRWWSAPLFASLWAAAVLCFVAYPAAYAGTEVDWVNHMFVNLWLAAGAGVLLLIPYWAFRPIVQPLSGFNGY